MKAILAVSCAILALSASTSFAAKSEKFNKDGKMKAQEVFKKCGDWAKKETASMKESTPAEKKAKSEAMVKMAESCSLNNGFDSRGK